MHMRRPIFVVTYLQSPNIISTILRRFLFCYYGLEKKNNYIQSSEMFVLFCFVLLLLFFRNPNDLFSLLHSLGVEEEKQFPV